MVYGNDSPMAVSAMENAHYGGDYYDAPKPKYKECPHCGATPAQGYFDKTGFHKLNRLDGEIVGCDVCMDEIDEYGEEYVE